MRREEVRALIRRFGRKRIIFHTYHDHYAFERLALEAGAGAEVRILRQGSCGGLLEKPTVKKYLASLGSSTLTQNLCRCHWPHNHRSYVMKIGAWPSLDKRKFSANYFQSSRREHTLVIMLTFAKSHVRDHRKVLEVADSYKWIHGWNHFACRGRDVLSWARVDLNVERTEAVIEEVQTDWIREAVDMATWVDRKLPELERNRILQARRDYLEVLQPHRTQWAETAILGALQFLRGELGVRRVWYHDFETSVLLKNLKYGKPPRSLYTTLPRRLCFESVGEGPQWIEACSRVRRLRRKARHPWRWWYLRL